MGVLGSLVRSVESPAVPLTSTTLAEWITGGPSLAGTTVNERKVLGLPAYYRGLALTGSTLAGLPLKVYRNGTREVVGKSTVLDNPNPRQTPFEFWFTTYTSAVAWGSAFARKNRDAADVVREVWPIHPSRVRVEETEPGGDFPDGKVFLIHDKQGVERRYGSWDIFHLPYMSADGVTGVRPMDVFRRSLGIAIAGDETSARFYGQGSMLSGVLTTEQSLDNEKAESLKQRWKQKVSGQRNAHDIAVLDKGATFTPISIPPADAQLLESRRWAVTEIARMLGVPPHLIGDVEKSTSWGTGIEEQVLGWVKFNLHGWVKLAEQRVTRELLPGGWTSGSWYAEASLEGLLRGDSKARAAFYHAAITDGWMTRNEVRALENREPAEGLDEFIVPSNMTLISVDGEILPLAQGQGGESP